MFCSKCGSQAKEDKLFCPNCGNSLEAGKCSGRANDGSISQILEGLAVIILAIGLIAVALLVVQKMSI